MLRYLRLLLVLLPFSSGCSPQNSEAQATKDAMIRDALRAAMPSITDKATIKDWQGNTLREGSNGWVCFPTPTGFTAESSPMCLDKTWQAWADAWANKKPFKAERVGISYMLRGDSGASNTDPYATGSTPDNEWVVSGPHLMLLVPDAASLDAIPTDHHSGGPFVMWKGTPYAHVMVPVPSK